MTRDAGVAGGTLREALGCSEVVGRICRQVARVAGSDFAVLIVGETGTGKELVARAIHQASPRAAEPFVAVDCGAIVESRFEADLFGMGPDATVGVPSARHGSFAAAGRGTLFLDDVAGVPLSVQVKLLRALQDKVVYPVSTRRAVSVDARLIGATAVDLETAVASGRLRRDLFFRLTEFVIQIPPLRDRREDLVFLTARLVELTNRELRKSVVGLSTLALQQVLDYSWPGNLRQLRATLRRAVLLADTVVDAEHLGLPDEHVPSPPVGSSGAVPLRQLVRRATVDVERAALIQALTETRGNKSRAARLLQIDSKTIRAKLKEYGISVPARRS